MSDPAVSCAHCHRTTGVFYRTYYVFDEDKERRRIWCHDCYRREYFGYNTITETIIQRSSICK